METLPPVHLGASIAAAFAAAFLARGAVHRRWVMGAEMAARPRRQFALDLGLFFFAGALVSGFNAAVHGFPPGSAFSLLFGCLVAGFFAGLDTALARERASIYEARRGDHRAPVPRRLYPVTRRFSLVALSTSLFICMILMMVISRDFAWLAGEAQIADSLKTAERTVLVEVFFIMAALLAMVSNLIWSYSKNLRLLFENETGVLEQVSRGDLSRLVPVATHDEFGLIAGHTNAMIEGLRHRTRLVAAMKLAEEVQQSLLPQSPPELPGGEVTGTSRYCDETGGDYYDYFPLPDGRLAVVVADASDHGVGAALHMAAARAFLVSAVADYAGPRELLRRINRFLARDHKESGRFLTLFFLEIDASRSTLTWVRAGHEPALLYEPRRDRITELGGEGMALGVVEDQDFPPYFLEGWEPGAIVLIGTDGIRETRGPGGEVFGTERIRRLLREMAGASGPAIQAALLETLERFRGARPQEDDVAFVIVRLP
jgi:sigma-B regulation protein RsbU (phosphoserine phosphatase)